MPLPTPVGKLYGTTAQVCRFQEEALGHATVPRREGKTAVQG